MLSGPPATFIVPVRQLADIPCINWIPPTFLAIKLNALAVVSKHVRDLDSSVLDAETEHSLSAGEHID